MGSTNIREDGEQQELSYTAGENINCYNYLRKKLGNI